ncbi:MAG: hydrogenase expression/formation protein HupK [Mangrovicoccus sp.]|nr:hydrogenase expression/formation protein HupK [Mangrovicoccus sp.]
MMRAHPQAPLRARPVPAPPVAQLLLGKPAQEAAALLPRLFNLCPVAQAIAARAAFDLPLAATWQEDLRREIAREHLIKLCVKWPAALGVAPQPIPADPAAGSQAQRQALFGPSAAMPQTQQGFETCLNTRDALWGVLHEITRRFGPGIGCRSALPLTHPARFFQSEPQENSTAARHGAHPVMRYVARRWGRGPLWSALGVAYDLEAVWNGDLAPSRLRPGQAVIPAARGYYGITARLEHGRVSEFRRITPTDHLLAPGGALAQSLAHLPAQGADQRGALLLSILDPCHPVTLEPASRPEAAHA